MMEWPIMLGRSRSQPTSGSWNQWKTEIAGDCQERCIYCAIHEGSFGGLRNFHVEHFRPKSLFKDLENDIGNLYLACSICNILKGDDWPNEPHVSCAVDAYPDPRHVDYNTVIELSDATSEISAKNRSAAYLIERLVLNRGQLIRQRRLAGLFAYLDEIAEWAKGVFEREEDPEVLASLGLLFADVMKWTVAIPRTRPYGPGDVVRSKPKQRVARKRRK
jgi:hypothetical protein